MAELLPCPFCGAPAESTLPVVDGIVTPQVECSSCCAVMGSSSVTGEEAWNRRALPAQPQEPAVPGGYCTHGNDAARFCSLCALAQVRTSLAEVEAERDRLRELLGRCVPWVELIIPFGIVDSSKADMGLVEALLTEARAALRTGERERDRPRKALERIADLVSWASHLDGTGCAVCAWCDQYVDTNNPAWDHDEVCPAAIARAALRTGSGGAGAAPGSTGQATGDGQVRGKERDR